MTGDTGKIRYPNAARVLRNYEGLNYNSGSTPSDIDGGFDIIGRLFVFFEFKRFGGKMSGGQQLFLERIATCISKAGKRCIVIEANHNCSGDQEIDCANCLVSRVFDGGKWFEIKQDKMRVVDVVNGYVQELNRKDGLNIKTP
jgi:hypothetical protein